MFIRYLFKNIGQFFGTWFILTIINQVIFFGACLQPYCILASIPHISVISLMFMYFSYKGSMKIYDHSTGLNEFGFAQDGYNKQDYDINGYHKNGYNKQGYHKNGYDYNGYDEYGYDRDGFNSKGLTKDKDDRKGNGGVYRFLKGKDYKNKLDVLNKKAKIKNIEKQKLLVVRYQTSFNS